MGKIINKLFGINDLQELGEYYKTDKLDHNYLPHYKRAFENLRYKNIKLIEIGVGGYSVPNAGGNSLRMWKEYFPKGFIYGIDIYDKSLLQEERLKIFQGSQIDKKFLEGVIEYTGSPDIIIDDGSHINKHIIETFKILFPFLSDGGIYAVEDTHTSYWPSFGGDSQDLNNPLTSMNFLKSLTDGLNSNNFLLPNRQRTYFDENIIEVSFYYGLVIIRKGKNNLKTNIVNNGILSENLNNLANTLIEISNSKETP
ncbi:MAG: hypothetical protein Ta2G_19960 [Termitinemataceae bacterium]|nr:MAG: hypothetical protein Ta2G_19960 [Termitinemataceae bacterium]